MEGMIGPAHLFFLFLIVFLFVPAVFYLLTLQKALARCDEPSRTTSPESVWLMLIPVFNFVYQFFLVSHISRSLGNEFARRGIGDADRAPGNSLGIVMCVLNLVTFAGNRVPPFGSLISIAALVCWISYWKTIADYSRMIAAPFSTSQNLGAV